ncbi:30S ribosomal protein S18 [Candidatus Woesebacteria bacterium GWA1_41_8]|uniref:Small ribosomal subunit protein bS18 n=1 Tax=Candidatus Woesebacteria bacterium GWA1_41_8 TaxID=1802471 RepID=A0A1F7WGW1_9BACT|nr:MAG: 30S ribosomal protein S18 [Candidatus Woesebacteria bacterium GWA1_41_8]
MAPKKSSRRRKPVLQIVTGPCPFCKEGIEPDYKNIDRLARYVSDRGKILGGSRTGVCSKHQRRLTKAIKQARHLGLLPYTAAL